MAGARPCLVCYGASSTAGPAKTPGRAWRRYPPAHPESDRISEELKRLGFKFVGTTICYALMQALGLVNDHTLDCYRHAQVAALGRAWRIER